MAKEQKLSDYSVIKPRQFSILAMLGFTTIVALIFTRNSFWATILAIEMIVVYLAITSLIQNLPSGILSEMNTNCVRRDGKIDAKRSAVEESEFNRLFRQLLFIIFILFLMPINLTLGYFQATRSSPDGSLLAISLVWLPCAYQLLKSGYLKALKDLHERVQRRHQNYWDEDILLLADKSPFDD